MSFCLQADEMVEAGIKRIVNEELGQAVKEIDNRRLKRSEVIHEVRKHCKKIRRDAKARRTAIRRNLSA